MGAPIEQEEYMYQELPIESYRQHEALTLEVGPVTESIEIDAGVAKASIDFENEYLEFAALVLILGVVSWFIYAKWFRKKK